jgi:hypothetical protein
MDQTLGKVDVGVGRQETFISPACKRFVDALKALRSVQPESS